MLSYSDLREIQKKELSSAAIVPVPKDFYEQLKDFLARKKKEAVESGSLLSMREYENIKRIASLIQSKREEKLLLMAARGECDLSGLSESEVELLNQLRLLIKKHRELFKEVIGEEEVPKLCRVRILKDIEPYVGLNKTVYGPFKKGEEHWLLREEAEWLTKAKMAEVIK